MPAPIHLSATKHKANTKSVGISTRSEVASFCAMLPNSCQLTQCQIIITATNTSNLTVTGQLLKLKCEKKNFISRIQGLISAYPGHTCVIYTSHSLLNYLPTQTLVTGVGFEKCLIYIYIYNFFVFFSVPLNCYTTLIFIYQNKNY